VNIKLNIHKLKKMGEFFDAMDPGRLETKSDIAKTFPHN